MTVIDAREREQALDVRQSFIVQAPAGSGKTGVLTLRILKLLATVERPEQILAITFTKKAAAEMRTRVAEALHQAALGIEPESQHEKAYFALATAALARDHSKQWGLLENLGRLRLQTIDSLCSSLVKDNPLTSGLGAQFAVEDDASELYAEATRSLLAMLDEEGAIADALFRVLGHFDNQYLKLRELIAQMLEQRDHWLRDVTRAQQDWDGFRKLLTQSLQNIVAEARLRVESALTPAQRHELDALTVYAINQLHFENPDHPLTAIVPGTLDYQKQQLALFLTKDKAPKWRSRLDKNMGFPSPKAAAEKRQADEYKARAKDLLDVFERGAEPFLAAVIDFIQAPDPQLGTEQWQLLEDLVLIVRYAAAHLKLVFNQRRTADFSEIALAALLALGAEEKPTDALLALDDRIAHILVDEFQDTSFIQVDLLETLTAGWEPGDGRTLFLVGDPMQSIYAFRKADVGLFLKLWHQKRIGHIPLQTVQLCMNFRSSPAVLDWVNASFQQVFPRLDDIRSGAVCYSGSHAGKKPGVDDITESTLFVGPEAEALALAEADWIASRIAEFPHDASVAILVKGKSHIARIATALRQQGIPFQAVDIETLADSQIIIDLLSLYQVCVFPGDKTAWFALLRGPWCGLTLRQLEVVAQADPHPWRALQAIADSPAQADADLHSRVRHVRHCVGQFYQQRLQRPFAELMRELALDLGMAATACTEADVEAMELFFDLLADVAEVGGLPDQAVMRKKLAKLFVPPEPVVSTRASVQVMTMHKSKGLEFDRVFLPQLHRKPRRDDPPLILVDKQTALHDQSQELFMAPAANGSRNGNSVYEYLWRIRQQRSKNESVRLLYVACTRARKQLYLTGCLKQEDKPGKPDPGSLLATIWPVLETTATRVVVEAGETMQATIAFRRPRQMPDPNTAVIKAKPSAATLPSEGDESVGIATDIHRAAGILLHKILENWARFPHCIPASVTPHLTVPWRQQLHSMGLDPQQAETAIRWIECALGNLLANAQRRYWLLEQSHEDAHAEYPLTASTEAGLQHWIIDRTFIENGVRHIIDYKLSEPAADLPTFLAEETQRYAPQLKTYRTVLSGLDQRPCRTYLYFPLIDHLQEVET